MAFSITRDQSLDATLTVDVASNIRNIVRGFSFSGGQWLTVGFDPSKVIRGAEAACDYNRRRIDAHTVLQIADPKGGVTRLISSHPQFFAVYRQQCGRVYVFQVVSETEGEEIALVARIPQPHNYFPRNNKHLCGQAQGRGCCDIIYNDTKNQDGVIRTDVNWSTDEYAALCQCFSHGTRMEVTEEEVTTEYAMWTLATPRAFEVGGGQERVFTSKNFLRAKIPVMMAIDAMHNDWLFELEGYQFKMQKTDRWWNNLRAGCEGERLDEYEYSRTPGRYYASKTCRVIVMYHKDNKFLAVDRIWH